MAVVDWLLDSDPAIRWQVLRDLTDASPEEVAAERGRVAHEGWGARLLALQGADGLWDGGTYRPGWADDERPFFDAWTATHFSLQTLREYGVDPGDAAVRSAVELVRENARWYEGQRYFDGETEACINGVVLVLAVYFGEDPSRVLETLLADQRPDGGWNCYPDPGSSLNSTICVLEGLLAWEQAVGGDETVRAARERGEEYLLERRLLWRKSSGGLIDPRFTMLSWPARWFYDVLRALDYFRLARPDGDPRLAEAVDLLAEKADGEGRFRLENEHEGAIPFHEEGEREGRPSRWVTLHATRVLRWADALSL